MLLKAYTHWECPWACGLSENRIELRQLIGGWRGCRPRLSHFISLYWRTCHLLLRFLCLHEAAILALLVAILLARFRLISWIPLHLHFSECSSGTLFSWQWSAMKYRRCQPPFAVAFRKSANWGSDVEHEAMESKWMGLALSLPLSPEHVRASSPVEFTYSYLYPSRRHTAPFPSV